MALFHSMSCHSTPKIKVGSMMSQTSYALRSSPSKFRTPGKKKRVPPQLTLTKRTQFHVFDNDGVDRTPKLLQHYYHQVLEEWQPTVLDYVDADMGSNGSQISLSRTPLQSTPLSYGSTRQSVQQGQQYSLSLQMSFTNIANVDSYKETTKTLESDLISDTRSEDRFSETAPSAFHLRDLPSREFYPPHSKVPLMAKETDSFTLFSMESVVQSTRAPNIDAIREDNEFYESYTFGKGKYTRKLMTSEQQTPVQLKTSELCFCPRMSTKNGSTWVTVWKLYDELSGMTDEKREYQSIPVEDQWAQICEDDKFISTGLIMERILGSPIFREVQLTYINSHRLDPLALDIHFEYSAKLLWEYDINCVHKKPVTAIAVNTLKPRIIAVGYGKFMYHESDSGYISIWSVKNPKHPERFHKFNSSVLSLDFAIWEPNLLAAGFFNGDLLILDASSIEKKIIFTKDSVACETYEKILFTKWWICLNMFDKEEEILVITTGDGRIIQFRRQNDTYMPFQIMRITKSEGKMKGINCLRKCEAEEIPMLRFPAARSVVAYPNDPQFYLVSTDDGTVRKCSYNFLNQHIELFLAHSGPVYALKFSPFCSKIFLTCGADGAVRLWAWDIFEPLISLTLGADAVEDAAWSPRNSTIIASISNNNLFLWDLRRKTYYPASTIPHPKDKNTYTTLQFSETGDNLLLGDVNGIVSIMALCGMPFEEQFKEDILAACIEKELIVKPKLLKLLKKMGPPFSS